MAYYQGTTAGPDQAKAIVAVIAVHVLLALIILSGLNVRMIGETVERLQTFNVVEMPPPPQVKPPPPKPQPHQAPKAQGAPAPKAEPTQVVAPPPVLPIPSIPAAKVAGAGTAATSGAAASGTGTGAGGSGTGLGGGGTAGFTPARRITKIPNREYRRLSAQGLINGDVIITVLVNPDGRPSNCRITRSSGSSYSDATMCQLTEAYIRFDPARDASGRPIGQDVTYYQNWWRP